MKLKKDLQIFCDDFWYDLTDGGRLKPKEICANKKDADAVLEAIGIIQDFQDSCDEQIEGFEQ